MKNQEPHSRETTEVAIVGAGPYGLSVASYLAARGISFRIFGNPMYAWSQQMPKGMRLKSEGFASSLADPGAEFTLQHYCREQGLPYQHTGLPVPLETFVAYGLAFQQRFVPGVENKLVTAVRREAGKFEITLADGEHFFAAKVVLAIGISQFAYVPDVLAALPAGYVSHSSAHNVLEGFRGKKVAVVGAGASAIDLAALLHQAGAETEVVARSASIRFHNPPQPRTLKERIFSPSTGIGLGMDFYFYVTVPHLFRRLPEKLRLNRVRKTLGPAPGWFIREEVVGKVPLHVSTSVSGASVKDGRVQLTLSSGGEQQTHTYDHVIAATGYRVDLKRLDLLSAELRKDIRLTGTSPYLSSGFESSVPGLYFIGVAAANSFGPVMRFAYGARYTAERLSRYIGRSI